MRTVRMAILAALMAPGVVGVRGESAEIGGVAARVARFFRPEMRRTEARLGQLAEELPRLPELGERPFESRYGFRSETLLEQEDPQWVQLDLGRSWPIDRLAVVPAHVPSFGARGEGYGFPKRFRIEVANDPEMQGAVTVVDRTAEDVGNPGRFPMIFSVPPVEGRYVRLTSTRHVPVEDGFIWALEEFLVLSGNNTVGVDRAPTTSSGMELFPHWSGQRLNDGQSALGVPVTIEKSPSQGYLSTPSGDPAAGKWLLVDLGREFEIDEIRLLPVQSEDFELLGGRGYPRDMMVELSNDPGFSEQVWRWPAGSGKVLGYPDRCAEVLSCSGQAGRYLRIVTRDLWSREGQHVFALAEVQAYSGGENVALGKPVRVSDATDKPDSAGWAPAFVVDGFTSLHRLIEYPEYLDLIEQRRHLVNEQALLLARRDGKVHVTRQILSYGGSTLGAVAALGWVWLLLRQRTHRSRTVADLRDQIARDLHDDIGSNLGGIVLLSERWSRQSEEAEAREGFRAIKEAAEETSASMQDIVWLIQRGNMGLRNLVARMRQSTRMILGDKPLSLTVDPSEFRDRPLSLLFRRHVFFSFKETLNNIRRHAEATEVEVRITIDSSHLSFSVRDNGLGFDPERASDLGHGLRNLMRRAARLRGTCRLESNPGHGSLVSFKAPLKS